MEKVIFKYELPLYSDDVVIKMPLNAEILSVQVQKERAYVWALCENQTEFERKHEKRFFKIYATGEILTKIGKYIGTFQLYGGDEVYHLFEVKS